MTLRTSKKSIMHPYMNADLTFENLQLTTKQIKMIFG